MIQALPRELEHGPLRVDSVSPENLSMQALGIGAFSIAMLTLFHLFFAFVVGPFKSQRRLEIENLSARRQFNIALRRPRRLRLPVQALGHVRSHRKRQGQHRAMFSGGHKSPYEPPAYHPLGGCPPGP